MARSLDIAKRGRAPPTTPAHDLRNRLSTVVNAARLIAESTDPAVVAEARAILESEATAIRAALDEWLAATERDASCKISPTSRRPGTG